MPRITTTTNMYLNRERKYRMYVEMQKAVEIIPFEKGEFLMADFQDESFVLFGGNPSDPCASVELNLLEKAYDVAGPEAVEKILVRLSEIVAEYCGIPQDRIFTYNRNSQVWVADGVNIDGNLLKF